MRPVSVSPIDAWKGGVPSSARKKNKKFSTLNKINISLSNRRSYLGWQCFAQAEDAGWPPVSGRVMGSLVWAVSVEILALPVMGSVSLSVPSGRWPGISRKAWKSLAGGTTLRYTGSHVMEW